jgi:phage-related holin
MRSLTESWYYKAAAVVIAYLFGGDRLVVAMYIPFFVLMVIDLFTGMWASRREGTKITSSGVVERTWQKIRTYGAIVVTARMLELIVASAVGIDAGHNLGVKMAVLYLATAEATSIDENLRRSHGVGLGVILRRLTKLTESDKPTTTP